MKNIMQHEFVKFLTENWIGGLIGLIGAPMLAVLALGPLESMMMSFTVGGIQLSALGYLGGAALQKYVIKR